MSHAFDIAVIGGGAAGCAAAREAARLGARVALIERERLLGGASWHRGRLPARLLQAAVEQRRAMGGSTDDPSAIELAKLLPELDAKRRARSAELSDGLKESGAIRLHARAHIISPTEIDLTSVRGVKHRIHVGTTIVATGDRPRSIRGARIDHETVLDVGSVLSSVYLPRSVVVAGASPSACEVAGLLAHLGCEVTLAVPGDRVLPDWDPVLGETFVTEFKAAGGTVLWRHTLIHAQRDREGNAHCRLTPAVGGAPVELTPDRVVVATKRKASVRGLGLEALGVSLDSCGNLPVDRQFRTAQPAIRAVGTAIGSGTSPARVVHQAVQAVRFALAPHSARSGPNTPFVDAVLSMPELASVGTAEGVLAGSTISTVIDEVAGLKLVADSEHHVVGLHGWGPGAEARLQAQAAAVQQRWTLDRLANAQDAPFERARQAARTLLSHGRGALQVELDPDDLLAGIVNLSTDAA